MSTRPLTLLVASTLTLVVAVGAVLFGGFLLAIAAGAVALLDDVGMTSPAGLVGVAALAYGGLALVAAAGLWAERAWSWPLAAAVQLVTLTGVIVAASTGGGGPHTTVGLALSMAGLAALLAPDTRRALDA